MAAPPVLKEITNTLGRLTRSAMDLLFPMQCLGCGKDGDALCSDCLASLPRLATPGCSYCAQPGEADPCPWCAESPPVVEGIRAACPMEGLARECVHGLKYRNLRALAPYMARLMAECLEARPISADLLVPIPLHPRRLRERGYNQAGLLAAELSKLTGVPLDEAMLVRSKNTPSQVRAADRAERQSNVEDCFHAVGDPDGLTVLLVDDVTTTGSTLSAAGEALKRAGAGSVWGLTFAREP